MDFLRILTDWQDPSRLPLEIIERKGIGHPDTLADALADRISCAYSRFCLEKFGYVLHHNLDKLYIGGGLVQQGYAYRKTLKPIRVVTNGRISNSFGKRVIDISSLVEDTVRSYLMAVLPHLRKNDVIVDVNSTQHTRIPHWFNPRDSRDLPETRTLKANDTSVCVAHWPLTPCERLAYKFEALFWEDRNNFPIPRFGDVGQDIKVLVVRDTENINITACVPIICTKVKSEREYQERLHEIRLICGQYAKKLSEGMCYRVSTSINPYKPYLLATGSCIECGEEGLVGRGNGVNGVISVFRTHSAEAPCGKNPVYHTGRVYGFLVRKLAMLIHKNFGFPCTVIAITQNGGTLIPPHLLSVSLPVKISRGKLQKIIEENLLHSNYLSEILTTPQIK